MCNETGTERIFARYGLLYPSGLMLMLCSRLSTSLRQHGRKLNLRFKRLFQRLEISQRVFSMELFPVWNPSSIELQVPLTD